MYVNYFIENPIKIDPLDPQPTCWGTLDMVCLFLLCLRSITTPSSRRGCRTGASPGASRRYRFLSPFLRFWSMSSTNTTALNITRTSASSASGTRLKCQRVKVTVQFVTAALEDFLEASRLESFYFWELWLPTFEHKRLYFLVLTFGKPCCFSLVLLVFFNQQKWRLY